MLALNLLLTHQRSTDHFCCCALLAIAESYIKAWCTLPHSQVGAGVHLLDCSAVSNTPQAQQLDNTPQAQQLEWACQGLNGVSLWTITKSQVN
jgi:phosphopantetheinyl transferase (holo-ACP synthase)